MPGAQCTRSLACKSKKAHEVVTTGSPELPGIPARNGFNGFLRALVSTKSARMCERAVLRNRPLLDLSPFVLEGPRACREARDRPGVFLKPEQLHGL
jgi:hypothetical protein